MRQMIACSTSELPGIHLFVTVSVLYGPITVHTGYLVFINMQVYLIYTVIQMTNPEGIYYLLQQQNKILPLRIKIHR